MINEDHKKVLEMENISCSQAEAPLRSYLERLDAAPRKKSGRNATGLSSPSEWWKLPHGSNTQTERTTVWYSEKRE
jgi:hypothetical protein